MYNINVVIYLRQRTRTRIISVTPPGSFRPVTENVINLFTLSRPLLCARNITTRVYILTKTTAAATAPETRAGRPRYRLFFFFLTFYRDHDITITHIIILIIFILSPIFSSD